MSIYFESREEAINQTNRPHKDESGVRFDHWTFIPYRESNDYDQLRYYHELGLEQLSYAEHYIDRKEMGVRFSFHWGLLTACHGYVLAHGLVSGNDVSRLLSGEGAKKKLNRDLQKKWFSHNYFRHDLSGLSREQRTEEIQSLVNWIINSNPQSCKKWGADWFRLLVSYDTDSDSKSQRIGKITNGYRQKYLSEKRMKALLAEPTDDIPPTDLPFPTP